jgi:site-specific DNA recombinase
MAKKKLPNKLSMIVNVVLYLRVSSEEQAKYGFSIDNQRIDCTNFAERNGYHVVKVFTDDGKSAKDLNRPEAKEMLSYMGKSKNHIDALIVWRLDRLTRNTMDYHGEIRPFLDKHNIKLLSATEPNDETIEGELFRNIGIDFADYERKVIGKRTLAGMKQKASL